MTTPIKLNNILIKRKLNLMYDFIISNDKNIINAVLIV